MTVDQVMEELQLQYNKALDIIAKLEKKVSKLEREKRELQEKNEELRRLNKILYRAMKLVVQLYDTETQYRRLYESYMKLSEGR